MKKIDRQPINNCFSSERFKFLRNYLNQTQEETARWLEVSQKSICNWEKGDSIPREQTQIKIAKKIKLFIDAETALWVTGINLIQDGKKDEILTREKQKIIILFFDDRTETYKYDTKDLIEYISKNISKIHKIQIFKYETKIQQQQEE